MVRVFLELGRVANLPTVWTNCVTAWVISGGARTLDLLWLCLGGTAVYLGGTFLNDVCDLKFDREHRQERAIPSGRVSARVVCVIGGGLLVAGVAVLLFATFALDWYVVGLVCSVVVYDMIHKRTALDVLFMGACRYLLYLVAASAVSGVEPSANVIWVAAAVGLYIVGLSVVARGEATGAPAAKWGMIPLAAPFVLGGYGVYIQNAPVPMVFFLVSLIWTGIAVSKARPCGKSCGADARGNYPLRRFYRLIYRSCPRVVLPGAVPPCPRGAEACPGDVIGSSLRDCILVQAR